MKVAVLQNALIKHSAILLTCIKRYSVLKSNFGFSFSIDKTDVLKTDYCIMKVESIAECSHGAFCNTFGLH